MSIATGERNGMTEIERYAAAAREAGCPEDQVRRFMAAKLFLQPRQLAASAAARLCDSPGGPTAVGYGGGGGGGGGELVVGAEGGGGGVGGAGGGGGFFVGSGEGENEEFWGAVEGGFFFF